MHERLAATRGVAAKAKKVIRALVRAHVLNLIPQRAEVKDQ